MDPFGMAVPAFVGTLAAYLCGRLLHAYPMRSNYEGRPIPVAGLSVVVGVLCALARRHMWVLEQRRHLAPIGSIDTSEFRALAIGVVAFGLLGALDDIWGDRTASGFRGHIRAALKGRFTTGQIKLVGGGLAALLCAGVLSEANPNGSAVMWLANAAVIALGANAVNLLDTRPVRATLGFLGLSGLLGPYAVSDVLVIGGVGAAIAWLPIDRLRLGMLGDAGANALGAFWGIVFVASAPPLARMAALVGLIAFHVYAERRSLNADIAAVPWLRRLDEVVRG